MKTLLISFLNLIFAAGLYSQDVKVIKQKTYDLIHVPLEDKIYVSLPAGEIRGNSICAIDPYFGVIEDCYFIGGGPNQLALSNDGNFIYIGLTQTPEIKIFNLQTKMVDGTINLGQSQSGHDVFADEIIVMPDEPNTIAVSRRRIEPGQLYEGVAIYDNDVRRPLTTPGYYGSISLDCTPDGRLFGFNNEPMINGIREILISEEGATNTGITSGLIFWHTSEIKIQGNFMYSSLGERISLENSNLQWAGFYETHNTSPSGLIPAPDTNLVYVIKQAAEVEYVLLTFDKDNFNKIDSIGLPYSSGHFVNSISWGGDGKLAFNTLESITIIRNCTSLITDSLVLSPDLVEGCWGDQVTIMAPDGFENYYWSTGDTTQTFLTDSFGQFYFYSLDSLGCKSAPSNKVTTYFSNRYGPTYIAAPGYIELCQGQTQILTSGSSYPVLWSNGETTTDIEVNTSGDYFVCVVSNSGCKSEPSNTITISMLIDSVPDKPVIEVFGSTNICQGDSLTLGAPPGYEIYQWSDWDSTQIKNVYYSNEYKVKVGNNLTCLSDFSEGIRTNNLPIPSTPSILNNGNLLASSAPLGNQWFLNGIIIPGAVYQFYSPLENGFYSVQVTIDSCVSEMSPIFNYIIVNTQDLIASDQVKIYPNPTSGLINLLLGDNLNYVFDSIEVFDFTGNVILREMESNYISIDKFPKGLYIIKLSDEKGNLLGIKTITKM